MSRKKEHNNLICCNFVFSWAFTVFIILNMFIIIVVLSNILIGQISFQYSAAQAEASIQKDIDRAKLITGLDRSILTSVSNIFLSYHFYSTRLKCFSVSRIIILHSQVFQKMTVLVLTTIFSSILIFSIMF